MVTSLYIILAVIFLSFAVLETGDGIYRKRKEKRQLKLERIHDDRHGDHRNKRYIFQ